MDNFINVTIPFNFEKNCGSVVADKKDGLNEAEQFIFNLIKENPHITIKELVASSPYSDGYVRKILASLKEKEIIERQGGRKEGIWFCK